jgi:hypothetical protein
MTGPGHASAHAATTDPGKPRVFIVDDHSMFRAGVRSELSGDVEIGG